MLILYGCTHLNFFLQSTHCLILWWSVQIQIAVRLLIYYRKERINKPFSINFPDDFQKFVLITQYKKRLEYSRLYPLFFCLWHVSDWILFFINWIRTLLCNNLELECSVNIQKVETVNRSYRIMTITVLFYVNVLNTHLICHRTNSMHLPWLSSLICLFFVNVCNIIRNNLNFSTFTCFILIFTLKIHSPCGS